MTSHDIVVLQSSVIGNGWFMIKDCRQVICNYIHGIHHMLIPVMHNAYMHADARHQMITSYILPPPPPPPPPLTHLSIPQVVLNLKGREVYASVKSSIFVVR